MKIIFYAKQLDAELWRDIFLATGTLETQESNAYSFLVVGDDAANKVGVGVPQCGHELGERLLVQLADRAKHALLGFVGGTKSRLIHPGHLVQAHDTVH